jgi:ribosomal protein L29
VKRSELKELHEQPLEHLESLLREKQDFLLRQIRMRIAAGEGVNPHEARETRRDIARIETLIREKQTGIAQRRAQARAARKAKQEGTE